MGGDEIKSDMTSIIIGAPVEVDLVDLAQMQAWYPFEAMFRIVDGVPDGRGLGKTIQDIPSWKLIGPR
jgi:hypothetical protein